MRIPGWSTPSWLCVTRSQACGRPASSGAIIEQAKGVLMERDRISAEEAFAAAAGTVPGAQRPSGGGRRDGRGRHGAQDEPAAGPGRPRDPGPAALVGVCVPGVAGVPASAGGQRRPGRRPARRRGFRHRARRGRCGAAQRSSQAVRRRRRRAVPTAGRRVAVPRRVDGHPAGPQSSWSRIPPARELPFVSAILDRRPYFWATAEERVALFPAVAGVNAPYQASAAIPVFGGDEPTGVVGLMWTRRTHSPTTSPRGSRTWSNGSAPCCCASVEEEQPELRWLGAILRLHRDPWILLDVIPSADGVIRDFLVVDASKTSDGAREAIGQRMLAAWPFLSR